MAGADGDGFGARLGVQLPQNGRNVELRRVIADSELPRNFLVAESFGQHAQRL
jgi:hypothetical protein